MRRGVVWHDETRVASLRKWWGEGVTARIIAQRLGSGITANAVIGKVHSLGLAPHQSPTGRKGKPRRNHHD